MKPGKFVWLSAVVIPVLLFLLAPYWSAIFTDNKKALSYRVVLKKQVTDLDLEAALGSRLSFSFDGRDIRKGTFVLLKLENTGDVPIREEDFSSPIKIETVGGELLTVQLMSVRPENLAPVLSDNGTNIFIEKLLLNPGDSFSIRLFSGSDIDVTNVSSRISGISQVEKQVIEDDSGIFISDVSVSGGRSTVESRVSALPLFAVIPVTFILMLTVFFNMLRALKDTSGVVVVVRVLFVFFMYGLSLVLYQILIVSLTSHHEFSVVGTVAVGFSILVAAFFGAYVMHANLNKLASVAEEA